MPKGAKWDVSIVQKGMLPNIKKHIREILRLTAEAARQEWVRHAKNGLRSTASIYVEGIQPVQGRGLKLTISLKGKLPNMIEGGSPPYDLKPGLLRSSKAKHTKKGQPYITVPFKLRTPGASSGGGLAMPSGIYKQAVKMAFGQQLSLPKRYDSYGIRSRFSPDLKRWGHYTWKTSPFAGITKVPRFSGQLKSSGEYLTFRRVSKNSDPNSWIHPGFQAKNFVDKAAVSLNKIFPDIVNSVIERT